MESTLRSPALAAPRTTAKATTLCEGAGSRDPAHKKDTNKKMSVAHRKLLVGRAVRRIALI